MNLSETLESATAFAEEGSDDARSDNDDVVEKPFSRSQKMAVKFLLNNISAGVIIGRGGTNITELQQHSGARIQLSRNNEFYPGTSDRVMLISGTVKSVLTALYLILTKLTTARRNGQIGERTRNENADGLASVLKLVMPTACCGAILGKGGRTVKQFVEESGASISVLPQNYVSQDMDNRIISISGELEQILRAVAHVVAKVAGDPHYINNVSLSVNYMRPCQPQSGYPVYSEEMAVPFGPCNGLNVPHAPSMMYSNPPYIPEHVAAAYPDPSVVSGSPPRYCETEMPGSPSSQMAPMGMPVPMGIPMPIDTRGPRVEMSISVPDDRIGAIIGKGGDIITQLQTLVGVKIIISSRNEFEPGTRNRRVTIIGPPEAVQIAHMLISMKERSLFFAPSPCMYAGAPYGWAHPAAWVSAPPSPPMSETNGYN